MPGFLFIFAFLQCVNTLQIKRLEQVDKTSLAKLGSLCSDKANILRVSHLNSHRLPPHQLYLSTSVTSAANTTILLSHPPQDGDYRGRSHARHMTRKITLSDERYLTATEKMWEPHNCIQPRRISFVLFGHQRGWRSLIHTQTQMYVKHWHTHREHMGRYGH